MRRIARWLLVLALCVLAERIQAHTFASLSSDLVADGDELSLTLNCQVLDILAVVDRERTTLTHSALIAAMPRIRAYLAAHLVLAIDGQAVPGDCVGYLPDLLKPPVPGAPVDEYLPSALAFLVVWKLPAGADRLDLKAELFLDAGLNGFIGVNLHQGERTQARVADLGKTITFFLRTTPGPAAPQPVVPGAAPPTPSTAGGDAQPRLPADGLSVWRLIAMGFLHIVPEGLDHILFVTSLFLLSPKLKPLLIQITAFTLAHSATLALAMAGWVLLPSRLVETIIAISITVMAVENILTREVKPWRWLLVFCFGLIHGLGFAGSFSALRMAPGDFLRPLLCLNLGVELGQLTVVAGCAALTWWCWTKEWYPRYVIIPASGIIAVVSLFWAVQRGLGLG
jgi:hypothetical protein